MECRHIWIPAIFKSLFQYATISPSFSVALVETQSLSVHLRAFLYTSYINE